MLNRLAIRRRLAGRNDKACALLVALSFAVSASCTAQASAAFAGLASSNCSASGDSLMCGMLGLLHFLYAAAGILALLLIVVVALAIKSYRKNKDDGKIGS